MGISQKDLLPDEQALLSKKANAIISLTDYGMSRFAFGKYLWVVGMKGKESIGGELQLTNFRLIFKAHVINRLRGKFSIFLPTIKTIRDSSHFVTKKVTITTNTSSFQFAVWGIPAFINQVEAARASLIENNLSKLAGDAIEYYERCGEGLQIYGGSEALNSAFHGMDRANKLFELATNPIEAIGLLGLEEFLDRVVADKWQTRFE